PRRPRDEPDPRDARRARLRLALRHSSARRRPLRRAHRTALRSRVPPPRPAAAGCAPAAHRSLRPSHLRRQPARAVLTRSERSGPATNARCRARSASRPHLQQSRGRKASGFGLARDLQPLGPARDGRGLGRASRDDDGSNEDEDSPMTPTLVSRREQIDLISEAIDAYGDGITILEAGCGRAWPLKLSIDYTLVGLDLDEEALRLRVRQQKDLDDYRVGDLRDAHFPPGSFDVIYCAYVLEHVEGVEKVLDNFARWIRPGGLIVLRIPDKDSVYALLARSTPHWFHVLFCKHVNGYRDAGKPGHAPYPVVYEDAMSRRGIEAFCAAHGFSPSVTAAAAYKRSWFRPLAFLVSALTLGKYAWRHNNLTYLIAAGSAAAAKAE